MSEPGANKIGMNAKVIQMDRLAIMKSFCRIVERGSIVRAAEDLGVSSALLSRNLKLLEQSLGCSLINRTTRTMSITEHGRLYYEESKRILEDIEDSEERVRAGTGAVRGMLHVNAPHSFGTTVLADMLPAFLERYPDVEISLAFDDQVVDMIEGGFDLSIRIRASLPDSGLIVRSIAPVQQGLFAAPVYLEHNGVPSGPEDLADHAAVAYLLSDEPAVWRLTGPDGTKTVPFKARVNLGSSVVLRDVLAAGLGIGALPDFLSEPAEQGGQLVRVLPKWSLPERCVYAVTSSRLGFDAKTLAFVDFLSERLA